MKQGADIQRRAFPFACRVVKLHGYLAKQVPLYRSLSGQLLRSGTGIGANLEEADGAQSRPDFVSKCTIALKEAREAHYWHRLIAACDLVPSDRLAELVDEANQIVAILSAVVKKARENQKTGN
jgi:four helix bundle protein